jgi:hypothetical protein
VKRVVLLLPLLLALAACSAAPAPTATAPVVAPQHKAAFSPSQLNLIAATGDPATMPGTPGVSAGVIYLNRVYVDTAAPARTALTAVITPGAGLANAYLGVYDADTGQRLAVTGDISAQLEKAGTLSVRFTTPLAAQPVNKELWLALVIGAYTSTPTLIGDREYGTNFNLTKDLRLWVSADHGYTALPTRIPRIQAPTHSSIPFLAIGP